jgi:hypothetical protein
MGLAALALPNGADAISVSGQGTWETTLLPRDLDGNSANGPEAFYDTDLNITWLRAVTPQYTFDFNIAQSVAATTRYGVSGWRLPKTTDTGAPGCDVFSYSGGTDCGYGVDPGSSEMAHLFYVSLGNIAAMPPGPGQIWTMPANVGLTNIGNFQNLTGANFWSGTLDSTYAFAAWTFNSYYGSQAPAYQFSANAAMFVLDGDVAAVPEPQALLMFFMGLGVLLLNVRTGRKS